MKNNLSGNGAYIVSQLTGLVLLRVLIGWHFLYEGVSKLINPYWSSAAYLLDSKWIFSSLAKTIVSVGMGFVLGYYLFAPPFLGLEYSRPGEGSYIIVNKNLIEACALWVLFTFPTGHVIGLDRFFTKSGSN